MTLAYGSEERKAVEAELKQLLLEAERALQKVEALSDKTGVGFYYAGPVYGMGGYYEPKPIGEDLPEDWVASDDYGWQSSSNC